LSTEWSVLPAAYIITIVDTVMSSQCYGITSLTDSPDLPLKII